MRSYRIDLLHRYHFPPVKYEVIKLKKLGLINARPPCQYFLSLENSKNSDIQDRSKAKESRNITVSNHPELYSALFHIIRTEVARL